MHIHSRLRHRRRGAVLVESAIVYFVAFLLLMGTIVFGLGIFRYVQISGLAREAARWAAVRGPAYQKEQNKAAPTNLDVMTNVITPQMIGLNANNLTCNLTMTSGVATVRISYNWLPEAFFGQLTLTSTSARPITY